MNRTAIATPRTLASAHEPGRGGHPRIGRRIVAIGAAIDRFVMEIYRTGLVQSFILHVALLLLLALTCVAPDAAPRPVGLEMRFEPGAEPVLVADAPVEVAAASADALAEPPASVAAAEPPVPVDTAVAVATDGLDAGFLDAALPAGDFDPGSLLAEVAVPARNRPDHGRAGLQPGVQGNGAGPRGGGPAGGGIDGELGRRLRAAGARTGDVQVSIRWDNVNDIDVHVMVEPLGPWPASTINYITRVGAGGGMLDVDANALPFMLTAMPVENVFWGPGQAPFGRYTVAVHHYRNWSGQRTTPVEVAILVDGAVQRFHPIVTYGGPPVQVATFVRLPPARDAALAATGTPATGGGTDSPR